MYIVSCLRLCKDTNLSAIHNTNIEINDANIAVGVEVKSVGGGIEIVDVETAFARDMESILGSNAERLIYPTPQELKQAILQSSYLHNPDIYEVSPASVRKDSEYTRNEQGKVEKLIKRNQSTVPSPL